MTEEREEDTAAREKQRQRAQGGQEEHVLSEGRKRAGSRRITTLTIRDHGVPTTPL